MQTPTAIRALADENFRPAGQGLVTAFDGRVSVRYRTRTVAVCSVLLVLAVGCVFLELLVGDLWIAPRDIWSALTWGGEFASFIVMDIRLPRALAAVMVGAAFGASGAIFQSVSRNALASPDIMGFTSGASAGAVFMILIMSANHAQIVAGAIVGGLGAALLVHGLAYQRGAPGGYRMILVGIGLSAMFVSGTAYMILKADLDNAAAAYTWLVGSLHGTSWAQVTIMAVALAVLLPTAGFLGGPMRLLEMGPDAASALGLSVRRLTTGLLLTATLLAATGVATAGPVAFIALSAPQIARRVVRGSSPGVFSSALMGAVLLAVSDVAAQRVVPNTALPVGVATVVLGGGYLVWLLIREQRKNRV
ncbi:iron chelate uptake ABC transporter family permease subunit [Micromonospora sp. B11E3]|uniref:FecCD family ABC transporter permease n=1 Tax=Micromonospora sp. B11E3 TaxID=3153562 RepID=UPI00325F3253